MTPSNTGPTLAQRLTPSIAGFQAVMAKIAQSMRVALPGVVQSFNPGPPATVTVLVATTEWVDATQQFWQNQPGFVGPKTPNPNVTATSSGPVTLPLLQDVPVVTLGGGEWTLTFPIQVGDECLVIFTDTPLDVWLQNGGTGNAPISQRRHSLSDGVAIVGWRSKPNGLTNYSTTSAQLRNNDGSVVIDLADNQITVTAPKVVVNTTGDADINASGKVNITTTGDVNVTSDSGNVNLTCSSGTATVAAQNADITGSTNVTISGGSSVTIGDNVSVDGRVFLLHCHHFGTAPGGITGNVI